MAGRYQRNGETETLGCLVQILLLLAAMPFVGLYLLISPHSKGLGFLLAVLGTSRKAFSMKRNVKGAGTSADCLWGCYLDHCFYDEMNSIQTNLKNTGGNRNESFA